MKAAAISSFGLVQFLRKYWKISNTLTLVSTNFDPCGIFLPGWYVWQCRLVEWSMGCSCHQKFFLFVWQNWWQMQKNLSQSDHARPTSIYAESVFQVGMSDIASWWNNRCAVAVIRNSFCLYGRIGGKLLKKFHHS